MVISQRYPPDDLPLPTRGRSPVPKAKAKAATGRGKAPVSKAGAKKVVTKAGGAKAKKSNDSADSPYIGAADKAAATLQAAAANVGSKAASPGKKGFFGAFGSPDFREIVKEKRAAALAAKSADTAGNIAEGPGGTAKSRSLSVREMLGAAPKPIDSSGSLTLANVAASSSSKKVLSRHTSNASMASNASMGSVKSNGSMGSMGLKSPGLGLLSANSTPRRVRDPNDPNKIAGPDPKISPGSPWVPKSLQRMMAKEAAENKMSMSNSKVSTSSSPLGSKLKRQMSSSPLGNSKMAMLSSPGPLGNSGKRGKTPLGKTPVNTLNYKLRPGEMSSPGQPPGKKLRGKAKEGAEALARLVASGTAQMEKEEQERKQRKLQAWKDANAKLKGVKRRFENQGLVDLCWSSESENERSEKTVLFDMFKAVDSTLNMFSIEGTRKRTCFSDIKQEVQDMADATVTRPRFLKILHLAHDMLSTKRLGSIRGVRSAIPKLGETKLDDLLITTEKPDVYMDPVDPIEDGSGDANDANNKNDSNNASASSSSSSQLPRSSSVTSVGAASNTSSAGTAATGRILSRHHTPVGSRAASRAATPSANQDGKRILSRHNTPVGRAPGGADSRAQTPVGLNKLGINKTPVGSALKNAMLNSKIGQTPNNVNEKNPISKTPQTPYKLPINPFFNARELIERQEIFGGRLKLYKHKPIPLATVPPPLADNNAAGRDATPNIGRSAGKGTAGASSSSAATTPGQRKPSTPPAKMPGRTPDGKEITQRERVRMKGRLQARLDDLSAEQQKHRQEITVIENMETVMKVRIEISKFGVITKGSYYYHLRDHDVKNDLKITTSENSSQSNIPPPHPSSSRPSSTARIRALSSSTNWSRKSRRKINLGCARPKSRSPFAT